MENREKFASRLGFVLISAGCAIGLGNVWRFPYIVGEYGGAAFVLIYLLFLVILGLPIMIMEFAVGRASRKSVAKSFDVLEPKGSKWHNFAYFAMAGNYLLMMFYTTVCGWMLAYFYKMVKGDFVNLNPKEVEAQFGALVSDPYTMTFWMIVTVIIGFSVCSMGLRNGVEKVTKFMMILLLAVMLVLAVRAITLEGASEGLRFYLLPDFGKMMEAGIKETVFAAMGQAFFTLSIGIGSMAIFGSYLSNNRTLTGEAVNIMALDTFVAFVAGLIIFPACFAFAVNPGGGPGLIFITLPNIFNQMLGGWIWGVLFFVFMSFAALTTVIAVFENIMSFAMDLWGWTRKKAAVVNTIAIIVLSMPCILGFNEWSSFEPMGAGTNVLDLEDFLVSNNLLPIGALIYLLFCTSRYGWGFKNFIHEADTGEGMKFPLWIKGYVSYVVPVIILMIFIQGYWDRLFS